jgi:hypothetical protein
VQSFLIGNSRVRKFRYNQQQDSARSDDVINPVALVARQQMVCEIQSKNFCVHSTGSASFCRSVSYYIFCCSLYYNVADEMVMLTEGVLTMRYHASVAEAGVASLADSAQPRNTDICRTICCWMPTTSRSSVMKPSASGGLCPP